MREGTTSSGGWTPTVNVRGAAAVACATAPVSTNPPCTIPLCPVRRGPERRGGWGAGASLVCEGLGTTPKPRSFGPETWSEPSAFTSVGAKPRPLAVVWPLGLPCAPAPNAELETASTSAVMSFVLPPQ